EILSSLQIIEKKEKENEKEKEKEQVKRRKEVEGPLRKSLRLQGVPLTVQKEDPVEPSVVKRKPVFRSTSKFNPSSFEEFKIDFSSPVTPLKNLGYPKPFEIVRPENIVKTVPERIYSLAWIPHKDRILVVAGDKGGNLGIASCDG